MWLAVVSQPFNANARVPCLTDLDTDRGEFWVSSPWLFSARGENLSAYERNGVFLNDTAGGFHDISFISGADSEGDGRTVVAWDVTGDGMPELFVRQAGGGPLLIFENRFPAAHAVKLSLRGTRSNSLGIGARIRCEAGGRVVQRQLFPIVNFLSQVPAMVHLGVGDATSIDRLTITWPSGEVQELTDLPVDCHLLVREGATEATRVSPGQKLTAR